MRHTLLAIITRECKLYTRQPGAWLQPLVFFSLISGIFAIILGDSNLSLKENAPGILWVGMILSLILSLEAIFQADNESGCLESILLSPGSKTFILLIKILSHSVIVGLPLFILSLIIAWIFEMPFSGIKGMAASLSLSIPALCLLGSIASALTVHLKRGGILLAILVLPLMSPIILFGSLATQFSVLGLNPLPHLAILAALLLLLLILAPTTCLFALRIAKEN